MPIVTADKVTVSQLAQILTVIQHVVCASNTIYYDQAQMKAIFCCLGRSRAEEKSPVSARRSASVTSVTRSCGVLRFQRICE